MAAHDILSHGTNVTFHNVHTYPSQRHRIGKSIALCLANYTTLVIFKMSRRENYPLLEYKYLHTYFPVETCTSANKYDDEKFGFNRKVKGIMYACMVQEIKR